MSERNSDPKPQTSESNTSETGHKLLAVMNGHPNGISDAELMTEFPDLSTEQRVVAINKLLQQNLIEILAKGKILLYRLKDPTKNNCVKGADNEEKIVYSIIEEGGNKGIWIRDIRYKSNLLMTQLNKILKNLENQKLIKAVKSVNASKKKVYMLYNLEPDRSITGGAWYQDQDFESEFVEVLNQQCLRFLMDRKTASLNMNAGPIASRNIAFTSVKDVHKFISELGISKVNLDLEDLETILKTLVYDGKAEKSVSANGSCLYRATNSLLPVPCLATLPCGLCPIINHCSNIGSITPKNCEYITEWLT